MSLATPDKIRKLQRKLYLKAKQEPTFYQLYDKIWRDDILAHGYRLAKANKGNREWMVKLSNKSSRRRGLQEELRMKTYRPQPVRRAMALRLNSHG